MQGIKNARISIFDFKSSIALKVILIFGIIIIISLFILGAVINNSMSNNITKMAKQRNMVVTGILKKEVDKLLNNAESVLVRISGNYGLRSNNQVRVVVKSMFVQTMEEMPYFEFLYFIPENGEIMFQPDEKKLPENYQPQEKEWYKKVIEKGEPVWYTGRKSISDNNFSLSLLIPVFDYSDKFMGVLGADISRTALTEIINWKFGKTGFVSLVTNSGIILTHSEKSVLSTGYDLKNTDIDSMLLQGEDQSGYYTYDDTNYLVSSIPLGVIPGLPLLI